MILLDTDHLSIFTDERDPRHELLNTRMEATAEPVACTICGTFRWFPNCAAKTGCTRKDLTRPVRLLSRWHDRRRGPDQRLFVKFDLR
jgi:hypothetical protein